MIPGIQKTTQDNSKTMNPTTSPTGLPPPSRSPFPANGLRAWKPEGPRCLPSLSIFKKSCPELFSKKSAFTLIELLVVVAIIGVLFAIAIPVFGNAGRKDTYRAAQQVATTLRLARQHAISKRQWTFVIFPNRDGTFSADPKALNNIKKCLRSYAVVAVTNNMDKWRSNADEGPVVNGNESTGKMYFEFVSDWKYLPEGVYFDDTTPGSGDGEQKGNYVFAGKGGTGYDASSASQFKFPYDPANPNQSSKQMIMSAVLFKPNGRYFMMQQSGKKHWLDQKSVRLYLTSARYYEFDGQSSLAEPVAIPGTNTMLQFQAKTGMVKILDAN